MDARVKRLPREVLEVVPKALWTNPDCNLLGDEYPRQLLKESFANSTFNF